MGLFHQYIPGKLIDEWQPSGPMAVYTSSVTAWLLIYQRLHSNASLESAVAELLKIVGQVSTNKRVREKTLSANSGSYCRARSRLEVEVTHKIADHIFDTMLSTTPPLLGGHHAFLMDGTTLSLSSNEKLRAHWPAGSNQYGPGVWPICHLVTAHELGSGMALRPEVGTMYGAKADSELDLATRILPRIPANSVLLADRNFGVFYFFHAAVAAGHDVVTRLTEPRFWKLQHSAELMSPGRWRLGWQPSRDDRKSHPDLPANAEVLVYLHEFVGFSGQTLRVVTTLDVGVDQLASLYARRWEIETDIRHLKESLQLNAVRGQSAEMVMKELAMATVCYNLVVQVRRLAAERAQVSAKRISFKGVWSLVTIILLQPNDWTEEEWQEKFEIVLRGAGQRKIPNRPGRSYPREVIPRRRKFPERRRDPTGEVRK
jgi:hypothetical protein